MKIDLSKHGISRAWSAVVLLLLASILVFLRTTNVDAKETESKKNKNANRINKPADLNVILPFDGNRIYNYLTNSGDLVTDNVGGSSGFFWPSTPRTSRSQSEKELKGYQPADYSSGLWIAGFANGQPRCAIVEYQSEYIPGKILPNGQRDDATLPKYRIYKIIKGDGPGVLDWDDWPAEDGAPTDVDGTPKLIGDQTLWFVMNDLDPTRHEDQGPIDGSNPIGLEVQTTVFGFNRDDALGDIMFVKWVIINKGGADLDSAYIGLWDDPDLGDASDDLVGCDTTLGIGFVYNGDTNDGTYGSATPALGFDFLQGPETPKGSNNFLKMTSFAKYTGGAPVGFGDPSNVHEVYYYMTGRWANGQPFIDPTTGQITKFIHAGDPVTRTGDLDFPPSDRRFLMSSGPFTLAVGDTQEIVGAKIIAPGTNPSASVTNLRYYDAFAKNAYRNGFGDLHAPSPKVEVKRLDQEIVLTWLEEYEALESSILGSFPSTEYTFQGYRVYQGQSLAGPFTPIATYDLTDGIQDIFDRQYDETIGRVLEKLVITAGDSGVQRYISIRTDAVYNKGQRLVNYRDYVFAVTSYFVNLGAIPKVLESPISAIRVAPSGPDYGVSIETATGIKVEITHDNGTGEGEFFYQVVDPTAIQTARYRITWNNDSTPEDGAYTWNLDRNEVRILSNQRPSVYDAYGLPEDDAPVIDGLQIHILPVTFRTSVRIQSSRQTVNADPSDNGLRLWGGGGVFGASNDLSCTFFGDCTPNATIEQLQADLEFRFTGVTADGTNESTTISGGQLATFRSRNQTSVRNVVRVPFELWDIENNVQINVFLTERNADGNAIWGDDGQPLFYRTRSRTYITSIHTPYNEATLTRDSFDRADPNATWVLFFHSGEAAPTPASEWSTGDVYQVRFANPTIPGVDEYTFSTTQGVVAGQLALAKNQLNKINVVPNPYWGYNPMESSAADFLVRITNLPGQGAKVRIFNLAGELVRVIDDEDRFADGTSELQYVNWNLRNHAGYPVGSGVYLVYVEVPGVGNIIKKCVVVMPEQ